MIKGYNIESAIRELSKEMKEVLSEDWKSFSIDIYGKHYDFHPATTPEEHRSLQRKKEKVIKYLLKDALITFIDKILFFDCEDDSDRFVFPFKDINALFSNTRKEDHQFEIIKEEIVSNLDKDGNPITAKPLNMDSVFVQWQDESKFKFDTTEEQHENFVRLVKEKRGIDV